MFHGGIAMSQLAKGVVLLMLIVGLVAMRLIKSEKQGTLVPGATPRRIPGSGATTAMLGR